MANPLAGVRSWLYHLGDVDAGRAREIAASSADLVVIDYAGPTRPYTPAELAIMRGGNDKLIVSYISIGEAESYRPYWKDSWNSNPPGFLADSNPEWQDNYKVRYWDQAWQDIIFKYVDDIVKGGFNGLYLDIVDAYQFWQDEAPNAGIDYEQEMATFVAAIRSRAEKALAARGDKREFVIIGQNGEELVDNPVYLRAIDGLAKEDMRFYYRNGSESSFRPTPDNWFEPTRKLLEKAEANGVEVFVVEYLTKGRQTEYRDLLKQEIDYLKSKGIPIYLAEDRDLTDIYPQPASAIPPPTKPAPPTKPTEPTQPDGTPGADTLIGTSGPDRLDGKNGSDKLAGNAGHDILRGGPGNDRLYGGVGQDDLSGGAGSDRLYGGQGNDVLRGGIGADRLRGDAGADKLSGGSGADVFVFASVRDSTATAWGRDTILDLSRSQRDKIDLSQIDAKAGIAGNQKFVFIGTKGFSGEAGELRFEKKNGNIFVYGDVNGDGKADMAIKIDGSFALKAGDFIL